MESRMSQGKVIFYKNKERAKSTEVHKNYVPQYQSLGIEPEKIKSATVPEGTPIAKNNSDNPRVKNIGMQQPLLKKDIKNTTEVIVNTIPTVGHNRDYTWSGVDNQLIDDLEVDPNYTMIDNNDYVTDDALGVSFTKEKNNIVDSLYKLQEQSYILLVQDAIICEGTLETVQQTAKDLVFGDHEICDGQPVPVNDIIVLKKVAVKIGLFLE